MELQLKSFIVEMILHLKFHFIWQAMQISQLLDKHSNRDSLKWL